MYERGSEFPRRNGNQHGAEGTRRSSNYVRSSKGKEGGPASSTSKIEGSHIDVRRESGS